MQSNIFCGIDVSKETIDCSIVSPLKPGKFIREKFKNNIEGRSLMLQWLKKNKGKEQVIVCLEHTGVYAYVVALSLYEKKIPVWMENALHIKRSGGLQRGKNDKVDADRIADFAMRHSDQFKPWKPLSPNFQNLKNIMDSMETLKLTRVALKQPINELEKMELYKEAQKMRNRRSSTLKALDEDMERLEQELKELLNNDKEISGQCELLQSIDGIGRHTALMLIYFTEGFTRFEDVKQFASYCGVVPFEHSSGKSIRGGSHVSHLSQKKMKTTLQMAAMAAVKPKGELRDYYERKVAEGKNKMSVYNAIRHKLLQRAFSVIRRNEPYVRDREAFVDNFKKTSKARA